VLLEGHPDLKGVKTITASPIENFGSGLEGHPDLKGVKDPSAALGTTAAARPS
jgi:hypothetical protein